ncbi:MAG TPA: acyl carrier protein [Dyadobacter sp.]|jgi:acyl carrier protein|nr:acyl carrier protein [Dyadobacter sp.]
MKEQLRNILATSTGLPTSSITDNASLTHDLGLDSLDTVDIVLQMEDQFKVSIPDDDYTKLQTVGAIYEYLQHKISATA